MGAIKLRRGVNPLTFVGANEVLFNSLSWINSVNISYIFGASPNGLGYVSFSPASSLGITSFKPTTDGTIAGYIIVAKVALTVDSALFVAASGSPTTQLITPTGLAATPLASGGIGTSWNAVPNAIGYRLQRATNAAFTTGLTIAYLGNSTSYFDTSIGSYYYRVLAEGSGAYSNSAYSTSVQATAVAVAPLTQLGLRVSSSRQGTLYPAGTASDYTYGFTALPDPLTAFAYSIPAGAVKVSSIPGIVSDADISEGSTTYGTDQTALIQQFLDQQAAGATDSNPSLINLDITASSTGLRYHSNQYIYHSPNCGIIMRGTTASQGTKAVWENYNARNFSVRDRNCGIFGGIINHNSFSGATAPTTDAGFNQVHSSKDIGWNCPVRAYNVDNFRMEGVTILRQRTFALHAINTTGMVLRNGVINAGSNGAALNSDGLHLNFTNTGFTIDNWQINSHDDAVAVSVDDSLDRDVRGGNSTYYQPYYQGSTPIIEDFTITNIEKTGGVFFVRVLSASHIVRNGTVKGLYGATGGYWLIMDNFWQSPSFAGAGPGYVSNLTFEDVYVNNRLSGEGYINECCANINCNATGITFKNVNRNLFSQSNFPALLLSGANTVLSNITWDSYQGHDLDSNSYQTSHIVIRDATVDGLHVRGARASRLGAAASNYLVEQQSGTLKNLIFSDVQADGLASLFKQSGGSYTGTVTADNVYHSNAGAGNGSFYSTVTPGPQIVANNTTTQQLLQGTSTN